MSRRSRIRFRVEAREFRLPEGFGVKSVSAAIQEATYRAALFAKALWTRRAQDLGLRRSGMYLQGIQDALIRVTHDNSTETTVDIRYSVINRAPNARIIEDGHAAFHLPSKVRWDSSDGRIKRGPRGPYLHIPFRHTAYQSPEQRQQSGMTLGALKQMMPADVHARAQQLAPRTPQMVGPIFRSSGGGQQFVAADRYARGGRLHDDTPGPRIVAGAEAVDVWRGARPVLGRTREGDTLTNPAWRTSRYQGLFKGGTTGHSQYMTIRTITPRSPGWNIPAAPAHGVARQVARAMSSGPGGDRFRGLLVAAITTPNVTLHDRGFL